jgi:hypothetical protein
MFITPFWWMQAKPGQAGKPEARNPNEPNPKLKTKISLIASK